MSDGEAILRWYLVMTVVTLAFAPLATWLGQGLGAARVGIARALGVVVVTAIVWWPAAVLDVPFTPTTLWVATVVGGMLCWGLAWRRWRVEVNYSAILAFEGLWLGAFAGYAWFRSYYPDIINTEKPMEIALLTSVMRSPDVPAPDPWLAGETINYYYFGYQMVGAVARMAGVDAAVAFNLALATLFASVACATAAAGYGIARAVGLGPVRRVIAACLAATMVLLAANLETARRLAKDTKGTIEAGWWDGVGWQASRIIVDTNVHMDGDSRPTINEFPAFSFVLGDLHPHVLTYPLLAAVLAIAVSCAVSRAPLSAGRIAVAGALAGLLYASNSWDAPLGIVLLFGGIALSSWGNWGLALRQFAIVAGSALIAALPFLMHYTPPVGVTNQDIPQWLTNLPIVGGLVNTFGVVYWRPTSVRDLVIVHGVWLLAFAGLAIWHLARDGRLVASIRRRQHAALVVALLALGISVAWAPAVLVIGVPLGTAAWIVFRSDERGLRVLAAVFALGFVLVLVPEFVFLQDVFMDRMNTVFKFYFQAWLLLAVASAVAAVLVTSSVQSWWRWVTVAITVVVVGASLTYAPLSGWDWTSGFAEARGLDGEAYLDRSAPGDMAAIEWIRSIARPGDWLVEAPGCSYIVLEGAPMSRVSAFSGVPALIGWYGHEGQWRRGENDNIYGRLNERMARANAILDGTESPTTDGPAFVILGRQERYGAGRCDRVTERPVDVDALLQGAGWVVGFQSEQTTVYVPAWRTLEPAE